MQIFIPPMRQDKRVLKFIEDPVFNGTPEYNGRKVLRRKNEYADIRKNIGKMFFTTGNR